MKLTRLTIRQLEIICAVVDCNLNYTAASIMIDIEQSGVSKQIINAEHLMKFKVFVRRGKHIVGITKEGEKIVNLARPIVDGMKRIEEIKLSSRRYLRYCV